MLLFQRAPTKWWNKPLALSDGQALPAELLVLRRETGAHEQGAWLNSRGTGSGVIDLAADATGRLRTVRRSLPLFVGHTLQELYRRAKVTRGCPDLVIWRATSEEIRLIEVKCPDWDAPTPEQAAFLAAAETMGITATVVEWRFV